MEQIDYLTKDEPDRQTEYQRDFLVAVDNMTMDSLDYCIGELTTKQKQTIWTILRDQIAD